MPRPLDRTECCRVFDPLPENCECFLPQMYAELKSLHDRHATMFTKKKRLLEMAIPKTVVCRFVPKCACFSDNPIQIVRLEAAVLNTRTEQLAMPSVRKLLLFKKDNQENFDEYRMALLNRLIRKSLLSMYSRLINVQPPVPPEKIHKWDKKEWKEHRKYLKKLAKPKKPLPEPKVVVNRMSLKEMKRFKKLAIPRHFEEILKEEWILTPELKNYKPTARVLELAKPQVRPEEVVQLPIPIEANALTYKATPRIKELAMHAEKRLGESDTKENPFAISPNALKAKPSARMEELAEPREFENTHIRENPYLISPAALKAKATPRLIELAKPRGT